MKLIADIVKDIREELEGAEHYAKLATEYKDENHSLADTYATMAAQELNHVDMLHVHVVKIIQAYRDEHGAPPEAMMAVWNWEHDGMVDKTARVKVLLDMYKRYPVCNFVCSFCVLCAIIMLRKITLCNSNKHGKPLQE